ncbi:hypothetical protein CAC42_1882 [Sphaceloma murrayae]|uniref:Uncharacterized protein n=1 Tax=Sphaceloma murrayae TaxID=2082308 RepID=A0A2K1QVS2_9PEZI|nr:hypothetical protein CAC42_1882 [Sphaceloma murrayae]
MLASKAHTRHPTWPPTVHLLPDSLLAKERTPLSLSSSKTSYTATLPEISEDEDPFSHFLSPVLDDESPFSSLSSLDSEPSYTAGITPYSTPSHSKRDALFRARLEEKWETFVARRLLQSRTTSPSRSTAVPAPLPPPFPQDPVGPSTPPNEDALPDLMDESMDDVPSPSNLDPASPSSGGWYFPSTIDGLSSDDDDEDMDMDDVDGWEADRRAAEERLRARDAKRLRFRSWGRRKRHAWRAPGEGIWTLEEEEEEDEVEAGGEDGGYGQERRGRGKRRKVVHWDEEVLVLEYER